MNPVDSIRLLEEICEGDTYDFHGIEINTSGTYKDTLVAVLGCDSIVTLELTVHPVYALTVEDQTCEVYHMISMVS